MRTSFLSAISIAALIATASSAMAFTITAGVGANAPAAAVKEGFNECTPGGSICNPSSGFNIVGLGGSSFVQGSVSGQYAAPNLSNDQGNDFGTFVNGPDPTTYLNVLGGGTVEIQLNGFYNIVGGLIGSLDTYNYVIARNGTNIVNTILGVDIFNNPTGDQGINGTFLWQALLDGYVDNLIFGSYSNSGEWAGMYVVDSTKVPDPLTLSVFGAGLAGAAALRRRKKAPAIGTSERRRRDNGTLAMNDLTA